MLSVIPRGHQNISQRLLLDALKSRGGFKVVDATLPPYPDLRLNGNQFLWANQFLARRRWVRAIDRQLADTQPDAVIGLNEVGPAVVDVAGARDILSIVFVRSLGVTGLVHFNPQHSLIENFRSTTLGGRIQYPLLYAHARAFGRATRQATATVVNSEYMRERVESAFGASTSIVYPPIDIDAYRVEYDPNGAIGMVNPRKMQKGGRTFLNLARALPDEQFLSCGVIEPPALADAQAAQPNWEHMGWVDDMREFYRCCKLVVVPSERDEAFGRAAAEPMASGIPVVASDIGGLPEVVGDTGELVPEAADTDVWVAAVRRAIDDHDPDAQQKRVERFSAERQVDEWLRIVEAVV